VEVAVPGLRWLRDAVSKRTSDGRAEVSQEHSTTGSMASSPAVRRSCMAVELLHPRCVVVCNGALTAIWRIRTDQVQGTSPAHYHPRPAVRIGVIPRNSVLVDQRKCWATPIPR
jgi:hypothetical protein